MNNNILNIIVLLSVSIIFVSCSESSTDSNSGQLYSVSGYVYMKSEPVNNATISIDDKTNYTTTSNSDGYFEIKDVPEGEHVLSIMKEANNNEGFSERNYDLDVLNNVVLNSLTLPEPIFVYQPIITVQGIELTWSPTEANDFREYKVFRNTSSGIDEDHGDLIHASTSRNDTIFIDQDFNALTNYYYRVYVMNDVGRLGGSNIVSIQTPNRNIVLNGDFEEISSNNIPEFWQNWNNRNFATSDDQEAYTGSYSVRFFKDTSYFNHHPFYQTINPNEFDEGERYRLTYWIKSDSVIDQSGFYAYVRSEDWSFSELINVMWGPYDSFDWTEFTYEFNYPFSLTTSNIYLEFYPDGGSVIYPLEFWLDNVKLMKVE